MWYRFFIAFLLMFESFMMFVLPKDNSIIIRFLLFTLSSAYIGYLIKHNSNSNKKEYYSFLKGQIYKDYFMYVGFTILAIIFIYNTIGVMNVLGSRDQILIITSIFWITYTLIPGKFSKERDFSFLFLNIFSLLFILPSIVDLLNENFFGISVSQAFFLNILLAEPLSIILNFFGIYSFTDGGDILYYDNNLGYLSSVSIARRCSGIYSIFIFISAFFALLFTELNKLTRLEYFTYLFLGILVAYVGNLFRMTIIVMVGHYFGPEEMLWAHANVGWLIFTIWISIYLYLFFRFGIINVEDIKAAK